MKRSIPSASPSTSVRPSCPLGRPRAERIVRELALAAHDSLGARDLSRVDILLDAAGAPSVLEVNTIPGFTSHSLLPKAARAAGIPFPELCLRLLELAHKRSAGKR